MKATDFKTNVVSGDVLIIGGGLAGLTAAAKIKEQQEGLDVLVVDKGGIGWAGQTPLGGGHLIVLPPEANLDEWVKWAVERGEGVNNIPWLYSFGGSLYESMMELLSWGLDFMKDPDGKLHMTPLPDRKMKSWYTTWVTHKVLLQLKKKAASKGAKMFDKVEVVDLLTSDGRVVGAVGFSILTGEFYVFKSKATLISNGACRYKNRRLWSMICGEGQAMAYRAGAEHQHSEFGTIHSNASKECTVWFRHRAQQDALVNAKGERFMTKYWGDIAESFWKTAYAMTKEVQAGRGPIYFDVTGMPDLYRQARTEETHVWGIAQGRVFNPERILREKGGIDFRTQKVEWIPGFTGGLGNIGVDLECKSTNLEGLWAAGDSIKTSIALEGAMPGGEYGGWGLPLAIVSGLKAGKSIAKFVPQALEPRVSKEQQDSLKETIYAPVALQKGFGPYEAVYKIQEAIVPAKYSVIKDERRLKEALGTIEKVQKEVLPQVKAANTHQLLKYHEARSMALCAEMTHRAGLFRTESRGAHIREDYPERDDKNWLKYTVLKKQAGKMALSTIPVPKAK